MKKIIVNHAGLLAQYNNVILSVLEECPTEEEFEFVFDDFWPSPFEPKGNIFYNDKSISCSDIGDLTNLNQNKSRLDLEKTQLMLSRKFVPLDIVKHYNKIIDKFFNPTEKLNQSFSNMLNKYKIDTTKTIFAYFRGTDGAYERPAGSFPVWGYMPILDKILNSDTEIDTIVLQSDAGHFYFYIQDYLWKTYPNIRVVIIDDVNLPNTTWEFISEKTNDHPFYGNEHEDRIKKHSVWVTEPQTHTEHLESGFYENPNQFSLFWTSISIISSKCKYFIGNKSNFSLFSNLYRKNSKNTAILDAQLKVKLNSDIMSEEEFQDSDYMKTNFPARNRNIWKTQ